VANQCEYHPYLNQDKLIAKCRERGMIFMAFSPLARNVVLNDPVIGAIAKTKKVTPAQITLRWDIQQKNIATIPKSTNPDHIRSNFDIFGFSLNDDEMAAISVLSKSHRQRVADPGNGWPDWDTK
jgi:2,5-diketo-D-gluconate reductase B